MSELVKGILIGLIPALVVSVATAWITVRLSLRQFKSERWWEKKAEAYSAILQHLSELEWYFQRMSAHELFEEQLGEEERKDLGKNFREARTSLAKAAAIGAYAISDNAAKALTELVQQVDRGPSDYNFYEFYAGCHESVGSCIAQVRACAKADLQRS